MNPACNDCGAPVDAHTAHPFREPKTKKGRSVMVKYNLCEKCCPRCFGGVGGTKENPVAPDN